MTAPPSVRAEALPPRTTRLHGSRDHGVAGAGTDQGGEMVELSVTDACGGIDPADLESVFEVGWRGTGARTPDPDAGAGLGLSIVRGLVEAHRGTVMVSKHGTGCRFMVRLPTEAGHTATPSSWGSARDQTNP